MQMRYFGHAHDAPIYSDIERMPAPLHKSCVYCSERILEGDDGFVDAGNSATHRECHIRMIVGSVAHQLGACSCKLGADAVDCEEGLTPREGAKLALAHLESKHHA
jgi:hypothetical protein